MIASLAVAAVVALAAEEGPEGAGARAQDHFEALVREIGALREDLDRLDRQERGVVAELDRLEIETELLAREAKRLAVMRRAADEELARARREASRGHEEVKEAEGVLALRLRELYRRGREREVRLLLSVDQPVDLLRGVAYLDVMTSRQGVALADLRKSRIRAERLEKELESQMQGMESLAARHRQTGEDLASARDRSSDLLEGIREDGAAHRAAIAELTRAAEHLESAIVDSLDDPERRPIAAPAVNVAALRGVLQWPVPGRIKVPHGDIVDRKFGTVVPHPGIDIETDPGVPIHAVMGGRVVFSRRFPGYGNTVLLDHGGRYLTVYARAAILTVAEGDDVSSGQPLGVSPEADAGGGPPLIYFEIRHEGKSLDPARWLNRREGARRPGEGSR